MGDSVKYKYKVILPKEDGCMTKTCSKCKRELDISMFHKEAKGKDGLRAECKECVKIKNTKNYESNRDKGTLRYWKFRANTINKRLYQRYGISDKLNARELKKLYDDSSGECYYCGKFLLPKECHIEHKVSCKNGGFNKVDNLVVSCPRCNAVKLSKNESEERDEHEFFDYIARIYNRLSSKYGASIKG